MSADALLTQAAPWLAFALIGGVIATAISAMLARSLFAMCMSIAAMSGLAAAAVLALGEGPAALALAVFGVGIAPAFVLAGMLLSARAAKPRKHGWAWLSLLCGVAAVAAIVAAAPELSAAPQPHFAPDEPVGLWLAALAFVAAAGCVALLGYGERGVLERVREDQRP